MPMKTACIAFLLATTQTGCTVIGWAVDAAIDEAQQRPVAPVCAEASIKDGEDVEVDLISGGDPVEGRFGGVSHDGRSIRLVDDDHHERELVPIENIDLIYASPHESGLGPYAGLAIGMTLDVVAIAATVIVMNQIGSDIRSINF